MMTRSRRTDVAATGPHRTRGPNDEVELARAAPERHVRSRRSDAQRLVVATSGIVARASRLSATSAVPSIAHARSMSTLWVAASSIAAV